MGGDPPRGRAPRGGPSGACFRLPRQRFSLSDRLLRRGRVGLPRLDGGRGVGRPATPIGDAHPPLRPRALVVRGPRGPRGRSHSRFDRLRDLVGSSRALPQRRDVRDGHLPLRAGRLAPPGRRRSVLPAGRADPGAVPRSPHGDLAVADALALHRGDRREGLPGAGRRAAGSEPHRALPGLHRRVPRAVELLRLARRREVSWRPPDPRGVPPEHGERTTVRPGRPLPLQHVQRADPRAGERDRPRGAGDDHRPGRGRLARPVRRGDRRQVRLAVRQLRHAREHPLAAPEGVVQRGPRLRPGEGVRGPARGQRGPR